MVTAFDTANPSPYQDTLGYATDPLYPTTIATTSTGFNRFSTFKVSFKAKKDAATVVLPILPAAAVTGASRDFDWAIRNAKINTFGSFYSDLQLLDFYWVIVEGVEGPLNRQVVVSYILLNGFSMTNSLSSTLTASISNFWN